MVSNQHFKFQFDVCMSQDEIVPKYIEIFYVVHVNGGKVIQ